MGQLLTPQDLLQQRLFDGLTGVTPQLVLPTALGDHDPAQGVLGRWPDGKDKAKGKVERLQGQNGLCVTSASPGCSQHLTNELIPRGKSQL